MIVPPSSASFRPRGVSSAAFSLVEVVLAIGVVSFAFVALLGLLPAGMAQFRKAIDTTVGAEIAQRVIDDAEQADFDVLTNTAANSTTINTQPTVSYRYFDERGAEVIPTSPQAATQFARGNLNQQEQREIVYTVVTRVLPNPPRPDPNTNATFQQLATVTVQVMNNPGFYPPQPVLNSQVTPALIAPDPHYSLLTFSAQVAPNTFSGTSGL